MKIFWSWQSDINSKISRSFIKSCIEEAINNINSDAVFEERVEIDHDTKNILGSPPIVDTILSKIKNSDLFISDVTPVGFSYDKKKKIMNPNVAIEMGYAINQLGDEKIISIMNTEYGNIEDLPFDLKHKRGPVSYKLNDESSKEDIAREKKALTTKLMYVISNYKSSQAINNEINYDKYGKAIFFDLNKEPIFRISDSSWGGSKDITFYYKESKSYLYIKILPQKLFSITKKGLKDKLFLRNNFRLYPIVNSPDRSPEINRYGCVIATFDSEEKEKVREFVQVFKDLSMVFISNLSIENKDKNVISLSFLKNNLERSLINSFIFLKETFGADIDVKLEIGIVNGNETSLVRPNPKGNKVYPKPVIGPLYEDFYNIELNINTKDIENIDGVVRSFITKLIDDIGIDFDWDSHNW